MIHDKVNIHVNRRVIVENKGARTCRYDIVDVNPSAVCLSVSISS